MTLDAKIRQLVHDLRGVLSRALTESSHIHRSVSRIRKEGWSLYLLVDRKNDEETLEAFELMSAPSLHREPVFRIDRRDLSFLRSIGIDPTRQLRRRRGS